MTVNTVGRGQKLTMESQQHVRYLGLHVVHKNNDEYVFTQRLWHRIQRYLGKCVHAVFRRRRIADYGGTALKTLGEVNFEIKFNNSYMLLDPRERRVLKGH